MGNAPHPGKISFDMTPMFGGKSSRQKGFLLSIKAGKSHHPDKVIFLAAKHHRDVGRYGAITAYSIHPPDEVSAAKLKPDSEPEIFVHPVSTAYELEQVLEKEVLEHEVKYGVSRETCLKTIGIDELNFFGASIEEFLLKYAFLGWNIYVAGLDLTAKGLPFPTLDGLTTTPHLAAKLDTNNPNSAVCWEEDAETGAPCGREATHTLIMNEDKQIQNFDSDVVQVGGYNKYFPVDLFHSKWRTPGELEHYSVWRAVRLLYLENLQSGKKEVELQAIQDFNESRFRELQAYFSERAEELKRDSDDGALNTLRLLALEGLSAAHYYEEFYLETFNEKRSGYDINRMLYVLDDQGAIVKLGDHIRPH